MSLLGHIVIVGATGAVGREMLRIVDQRGHGRAGITLFASERSAGVRIANGNGTGFNVQALTRSNIEHIPIHRAPGGQCRVALFSAGRGVSADWARAFVERGWLVVDNSSAFRMDPATPLVIPEVNGHELRRLATPSGGACGIVAVPNCSAIVMLMALEPLRRSFGVERIVVSTYQAASGAGTKGLAELESQTRGVLQDTAVLAGGVFKTPAPGAVFHEPYAFNLFSHNTAVDPETGLNVEEQKMIEETRKIWADPVIQVCPTCIRVPVLRAHSESISVTLRAPATLNDVRAAYVGMVGVRVVDDRAGNRFPTPLKATGGDDILVGRLRADPGIGEAERTRVFHLFACGDQLRKGAALNAVQIAEHVAGMKPTPA